MIGRGEGFWIHYNGIVWLAERAEYMLAEEMIRYCKSAIDELEDVREEGRKGGGEAMAKNEFSRSKNIDIETDYDREKEESRGRIRSIR